MSLSEFQDRGISLQLAGDNLRARCSRPITPEERSLLVEHKSSLLAELKARRAFFGKLAGDPDAWCEFENQMEERAAILEFDGGLSRDEATTQAEVMTADFW